MAYQHVILLSPPFYSHFMPMMAMAKSFKKAGLKVTIGCSKEFEEAVISSGLKFEEINMNTNRNTGTATETQQPESERVRLQDFFDATREGPVETLIVQMKHREMDMLPNPRSMMERIMAIEKKIRPDLWIVDVLSYGATLSLYCLGFQYITYCPPHPDTIPCYGEYYGIPRKWPSCLEVDMDKMNVLKAISTKTQEEFTSVFNHFISEYDKRLKKVDNAFSLASAQAIIYNYFDFDHEEDTTEKPFKLYIGHSFEEETLNESWQAQVTETGQKKILITLGTFLSERSDVLEQLITACQEFDSEALVIVSAGSSAEKLKGYATPNTIIKDFIPQKGIVKYMDVVIHHGGCNTFTESVFYGKPMIILPFSSDQFSVAFDAEDNKLAVTINPNELSKRLILEALNTVFKMKKNDLIRWSHFSKERGPDYAAELIKRMK